MGTADTMVIVGAGHCGVRAAQMLREYGWTGDIALFGDEGRPPYERPPLSKSILLEHPSPGPRELHDEAFYRDLRIDLRLDSPVVAIKRETHTVELASGETQGYHRLLVATGAQPRRLDLPGSELAGVHVLRGFRDALAIGREFGPGRRIVVIGAGFIGLEVAAAARQRDCSVIVLEAASRALMRAVPEAVAQGLVDAHRHRGVDVRFSVQLKGLVGNGRVEGVQFCDGTTLGCDAVIVGIGVLPRTRLAEAAGLNVANGIAVDETLRTNDPHIYAAGDVCSFPHRQSGRRIRLECWKNAEDQARVAARNMLGGAESNRAVPWFWSDQYDVTVQVAGMPVPGTATVIRNAGTHSRIFFALDDEGVVVGASGIGSVGEIARDLRVAQELIGLRACIAPQLLVNCETSLKALLASRRRESQIAV
jgi:3-phenylpropionate/trans-cinnamate dioxygenase ferredoxin reductase component